MNMKRTFVTIAGVTALISVIGLLPAYAESTSSPSLADKTQQMQASVHDAWLKGKLEATLLFNEHLNSFAIETDVKNGVASLNGAVASDIDRDLAGEIAKSIEGVNQVENNLTVDRSKAHSGYESAENEEHRSFQRTVRDATLTAKVKTKLLLNENTSGLAINVDTDNGAVTLSGKVDSEEEKELAVRIAQNTEGARSVSDRLTIRTRNS